MRSGGRCLPLPAWQTRPARRYLQVTDATVEDKLSTQNLTDFLYANADVITLRLAFKVPWRPACGCHFTQRALNSRRSTTSSSSS